MTHHQPRPHARATIELTSYAEVVLAPPRADALHPAFSNLFVRDRARCRERRRSCARAGRASADEQPPWMMHLLGRARADSARRLVRDRPRRRFIGRGRSLARPQRSTPGARLSRQRAARCSTRSSRSAARVALAAGRDGQRSTSSPASPRRASGALELVDKYRDRQPRRPRASSWPGRTPASCCASSRRRAAQAHASSACALAMHVPHAEPARAGSRRSRATGAASRALWALRDLRRPADRAAADRRRRARSSSCRQLVQAHAYWRLKGLAVDLVIWNEDPAATARRCRTQIMALIAARHRRTRSSISPAASSCAAASRSSDEDRVLLQAVARVVLTDSRGHARRAAAPRRDAPQRRARASAAVAARRRRAARASAATPTPASSCSFDNGIGGFSADGREYVMTTGAGRRARRRRGAT